MSGVGWRVKQQITRASMDIVNALSPYGAAPLADTMGRFQCPRGIRRFGKPGIQLAGTALTVKVSPADNLLIHKAVDLAAAGDVIVVDGGGEVGHALLGDVLVRMAMKRGVRGFVVDGAIRDVATIRELGFPVYARGVTPSGPYKDGPGEVNFPIACGGVVVHPGDIVIGDDDGIVFIPQAEAETVLERVKEHVATEQALLEDLEAGTLNRDWVDAALRAKGCVYM